MKTTLVTGIFLLFILIVGCQNQGGDNTAQTNPVDSSSVISSYEDVHAGEVFRDVEITKNPEHSYALFLPEKYSRKEKWPVIFIFDPHAKGWFPVERYFTLANRFGYVLIASNQSRNGLSPAQLNQVIGELFEEAFYRYSLDPGRVYMMGFSGGARMASSIALGNPAVRGVIACGGGLPGSATTQGLQADFLGFVGTDDFNFNEMMQLEQRLDSTNLRHHLIIFRGKHEWPDSAIMSDGFYWTRLNEMKDDLIPVDSAVINGFVHRNMEKVQQSLDGENIANAYRILTKLRDFTENLIPDDSINLRISDITASPAFLKWQQEQTATYQYEEEQKSKYIQAFRNKDKTWWKKTTEDLTQQINDESGMKQDADRRILNFLSLASYIQVDAELRSGNIAAAEHLLEIYRVIDPENPDVWYFSSVINARKGNVHKTYTDLQHAVSLGFNDLNKLMNEKAFSSLSDKKKFRKILEEIGQGS